MTADTRDSLAVGSGGLTSFLWFATDWSMSWDDRVPLLWIPFAVLTVLLVLGWTRKQFAPALGYLLGVSLIIVMPLFAFVFRAIG